MIKLSNKIIIMDIVLLFSFVTSDYDNPIWRMMTQMVGRFNTFPEQQEVDFQKNGKTIPFHKSCSKSLKFSQSVPKLPLSDPRSSLPEDI